MLRWIFTWVKIPKAQAIPTVPIPTTVILLLEEVILGATASNKAFFIGGRAEAVPVAPKVIFSKS